MAAPWFAGAVQPTVSVPLPLASVGAAGGEGTPAVIDTVGDHGPLPGELPARTRTS